jgi:hypothetical protein
LKAQDIRPMPVAGHRVSPDNRGEYTFEAMTAPAIAPQGKHSKEAR